MRFARFRPARRESSARPESAAQGSVRRRWSRWIGWIWPILAIVVLHQVLFPPARATRRVEYEVGQVLEQEIRAPFEFSAPRPQSELEEARRIAKQKVEPVFVRDRAARRRTQMGLEEFYQRAASWAATDSTALALGVAELQGFYPGLLSETLVVAVDSSRRDEIRQALDAALTERLDTGIVDAIPPGNYLRIWVIDGDRQDEMRRVAIDELHIGYRLQEDLESALRSSRLGDAESKAAADLGRYFVLPNLTFDEAQTEERRQAAVEAVPVDRIYAKNERVVDRAIGLTRHDLDVLEIMQVKRFEDELQRDRSIRQKMRGGRALLLVLVLVGAIALIRQVELGLIWQTHRYLLVFLLWALFLVLSALVLSQPQWGGAVAVPIALLGMLAVILYGEDSAYRIVAAGLLMLWMLPEHSGSMGIAWAAVGVVSVRSLRRVRNRNQFYRAMGWVAGAAFFAVLAVEVGRAAPLDETFALAARAVGAVAACTAVALFLLPLFEAVFGVTTELTLLELSDLNHPLVRQMSLETPGTFHHSQVVGMLGEAGARAIGANSLLTRVGANFHDIGKMLKPRYFAENLGEGNPHDELTPQMSALVIASHVKDGIELGREWGLPASVLAFIPEHHGTSVMQYFYKKALETDDGGTIKVDDFRYPGPKPQTKETAILMLADGCEASVRSLRRPTPSRVREMVRRIFDGKMADGELDECSITLQELALVREAFIPTLVGIHHQRVSYPGQRAHEDKKEQESREARARARRSGTSVGTGA